MIEQFQFHVHIGGIGIDGCTVSGLAEIEESRGSMWGPDGAEPPFTRVNIIWPVTKAFFGQWTEKDLDNICPEMEPVPDWQLCRGVAYRELIDAIAEQHRARAAR